jgi:hypothetical protein
MVGDEKDQKQDDASESEESYNSEYYDDEGRYIWGAEGTDWEFYYEEDKEAGDEGIHTMIETLNEQALPD